MMDSGSVVKEALANVKAAMKERGFSAKGPTFHRKADGGNTIMMSVQRSKKSTDAECLLTVNYGVFSARVARGLQEDVRLDVFAAHWRERLVEGGREKWLHVSDEMSAGESTRSLLDAIESVLPDLIKHSTDDALRDEWFTGSSPGLVPMQRLLYLAILVNEIGPVDKLRSVVGELRTLVSGTVHEGLTEGRLARAGVMVEG